MRLRHLPVDYFDMVSRSSAEECRWHFFSLPVLMCTEDIFNCFGKWHRVHQGTVLDVSHVVGCLQVPLIQDFPWVENTVSFEKFLEVMLPEQIESPNIDLEVGVSSFTDWTQYHSRDNDNKTMICRKGVMIMCELHNISDTQEDDPGLTVNEMIQESPQFFDGKQNSFYIQAKEAAQDPETSFFKLLEIKTSMLELPMLSKGFSKCTPLFKDFSRMFSELHQPAVRAAKIEEAALELKLQDRLNNFDYLRDVLEDFISEQIASKMDDNLIEIALLEVLMIGDERHVNHIDSPNKMYYPVMPVDLLQQFELRESNAETGPSKESNLQKGTEKIVMGNFGINYGDLEDKLKSNVFDDDDSQQQLTLLSDFLSRKSGLDLNCVLANEPKDSDLLHIFHCLELTFEIPETYDRRFRFLNPSIVAKDTAQAPVKELLRLDPAECFHTLVAMPDLRLDDHHFQSLPVPLVTYKQAESLDIALGRLISFDCDPSPFPATDRLYLDWHFSHDLNCTDATCFKLHEQLTDVNRCTPLPCSFLQNSRKCSEPALKPSLLVDDEFLPVGCCSFPSMATNGDNVEFSVCSPWRKDSQATPFHLGEVIPPEAHVGDCRKHRRGSDPDADRIAGNVSRSSSYVSEKSITECTFEIALLEVSNLIGDSRCGRKRDPRNNLSQEKHRSTTQESTVTFKGNSGNLNQEVGIPRLTSDERTRKILPSSRHDLVELSSHRPGSSRKGQGLMSSDLDFFIQARKGTLANERKDGTVEDKRNKTDGQSDMPSIPNPVFAPMTQTNNNDERAIISSNRCEHKIELSAEIRKCMVCLSLNYSALLASENCFGTTTLRNLRVPEKFGFDSDGNDHLISIMGKVASEEPAHLKQTLLRGLIGLHVLRYTALNLCNYGIQVAHLYLENFLEKMSFLEGYIVRSRIELEEAYGLVERGVLEDHPKLSHLDELLRPLGTNGYHDEHSSKRILLLADGRAFFTLIKKLVSIGLAPYQIDRKGKYLLNGVLDETRAENLKEEILEALTFSNCLLVSYVDVLLIQRLRREREDRSKDRPYLNPSFPLQSFAMIIQYANDPNVNKVDGICTGKSCEIHVFKLLVDPEEFQLLSSNSPSPSEGHGCQDLQDHDRSGTVDFQKPNTVVLPTTEVSPGSSTLSKHAPPLIENHMPVQLPSISGSQQPVERYCSVERRCEMIIVANISTSNEWLLTGRRSSFQKVLCLERENLQIVERELRLPIDLILSSASCVTVYTLGKLDLQLQDLEQKETSLQNQVSTQLKAISFSFRDCIMIFEGPTEFTSASLDIFDHIYALAIAFGMQIQCFASRHMEVTDKIISGSIEAARKTKQMPSYPIMTEGPTLAESFLTEFPSINPLTAHAILSSRWPLRDYITLAHEQQFAAVKEFEVPQQCLDLFKAQCSTYKAIANVGNPDCEDGHARMNHTDTLSPFLDRENEINLLECQPTVEGFSDFPPACKVRYPGPAHDIGLNQAVCSYPEFPSASEVSDCQVDSPEAERFSSDLPGLDLRNLAPDSEDLGIEAICLSQHDSSPGTHPRPLFVTPDRFRAQGIFKRPREVSTADILHCNKRSWPGTKYLQIESATDPYIVQKVLKRHEPTNLSRIDHGSMGNYDQSFGGEREDWIGDASLPGGQSDHLDVEDASLIEELNWNEEFGLPRSESTDDSREFDDSSFSFILPTSFSGGHRRVSDNILGNWNDNNRSQRDVTRGFRKENNQLNDGIPSELHTSPLCFGDISYPPKEWDERITSTQRGAPISNRFRHLSKRKPPLNSISCDKFRYQATRPAIGTARRNLQQKELKVSRSAPPTRKQSPNITNLSPATKRHSAFPIQILGKTIFDNMNKKALGCTRRGSDTQLRLIWRENDVCPKRQRIDGPNIA